MTDGSGNLFGWTMEAPKVVYPSPPEDEDRFYILDEHRRPVLASKEEWDRLGDVEVARTELGHGYVIDTAFDGWPRPTVEDGTGPFVFRTTVYSPGDDCEVDSYCNWEEAQVGHWGIVERYRKRLADI